jgi:general secretion pathway protein B
MSFILDALRKSENSRLRQEHPAMFDARAVASRRPLPVWGIAVGLLLGLNLVVVLFVLLRQERAAVAAVPDKVVETAAEAVVAAPIAPAPAPVAATRTDAAVAAPPAAARAQPAAAPRPVPGTVTREASGDGVASVPAAARATARTRDDLLAGGAAVPETALALHVYDPDPAMRFILLNGQRLREGDMSGNGLRVLGIVPDGVVLDHRGDTFKVSIDP